MDVKVQGDMLSGIGEPDLVRLPLADLHRDLTGHVARYRQLNDLSAALGSNGSMIFGEVAGWHGARPDPVLSTATTS